MKQPREAFHGSGAGAYQVKVHAAVVAGAPDLRLDDRTFAVERLKP